MWKIALFWWQYEENDDYTQVNAPKICISVQRGYPSSQDIFTQKSLFCLFQNRNDVILVELIFHEIAVTHGMCLKIKQSQKKAKDSSYWRTPRRRPECIHLVFINQSRCEKIFGIFHKIVNCEKFTTLIFPQNIKFLFVRWSWLLKWTL